MRRGRAGGRRLRAGLHPPLTLVPLQYRTIAVHECALPARLFPNDSYNVSLRGGTMLVTRSPESARYLMGRGPRGAGAGQQTVRPIFGEVGTVSQCTPYTGRKSSVRERRRRGKKFVRRCVRKCSVVSRPPHSAAPACCTYVN
ncbi:hypothetical protein EVAR_39788_1 [Eumeta japonica]|uniref:Uncharacterized protein n=1 Tax=Eumeta variegata TaxID=151549 RepID=A0A4C1X2X9_EUMVA|nr:hypothetical protein EVAR_39788_1 [Eumeta japonica]